MNFFQKIVMMSVFSFAIINAADRQDIVQEGDIKIKKHLKGDQYSFRNDTRPTDPDIDLDMQELCENIVDWHSKLYALAPISGMSSDAYIKFTQEQLEARKKAFFAGEISVLMVRKGMRICGGVFYEIKDSNICFLTAGFNKQDDDDSGNQLVAALIGVFTSKGCFPNQNYLLIPTRKNTLTDEKFAGLGFVRSEKTINLPFLDENYQTWEKEIR